MMFTDSNYKLKSVDLKQDKHGYYLRVKYEREDKDGTYELLIPNVRLPFSSHPTNRKHERYYDGTGVDLVDLGFGDLLMESATITDWNEYLTNVKWAEKCIKAKPRKMTVAEIEKQLGYPVEIVSDKK